MKKDKKTKKVIKVEELNAILDRTIGFVGNCDTKASIMLALYGVLLTVLCTSNVTDSIITIIEKMKTDTSGGDYFYILCIVISMLLIVVSIIELVLVLGAKIDISGLDSKIYFRDIAENVNCCTYGDKIRTLSEDSYIEDMISQIYINARICTKKYERYNLAIKFGTVGIIILIMLLFAGLFIY